MDGIYLLVHGGTFLLLDGGALLFLDCVALLFLDCVVLGVTHLMTEQMKRIRNNMGK